MDKVLIFGAGGFVGNYLAKEFLASGYSVTGSDIADAVNLPEGVAYFKGDLLDAKQVEELILAQQPQIIVNLAAISSVGASWSIQQATISVNVVGALNILEAAEELEEKGLKFSSAAWHELRVLAKAVDEIIQLSFDAFCNNDLATAYQVEPLEQVIDDLKEQLRVRHIQRLQQGICSIETGFVWSDLLNGLERTGDHCSNIAGCVVDRYHHDMNTHEALRSARIENPDFAQQYKDVAKKYAIA